MQRLVTGGIVYQSGRRSLNAVGLLLLYLTCPVNLTHAGTPGSDTDVKPEFYLAGITKYVRGDGTSASYDVVSATAELTAYREGRRYYGGLFANYRYSSSKRVDENLNLGAYFRYNLEKWDTTTWLFVNQSPGNADTWMYASRLRYRMTENYKLGIEAMAPVADANAPKLMLGYYSSISDSLSLNILAGTDVKRGADLEARLEFSWQLRQPRFR